jgi:hypothetical protein
MSPSDPTLNPTSSKPSRKQRRQARLAQAKEGILAPKLSRKQRQCIRKAKAAAASLPSDLNAPGPSHHSPDGSDDASYHSSQDASFMPSASEESEESQGSDHDMKIKIRKTKPVTDPEAWLRSKQLIKP